MVIRLPWCLSGKESACNAGTVEDAGLVPGLGRFPWRRAWQPTCLEYSCLKNPMDRGAWRAEYIQSQRVGHNWSDLAYIRMIISRGKTKIKIDWIKEIKLQNLFYSSGQTSNQFQEDQYTHTHTPVWTLDKLFKFPELLLLICQNRDNNIRLQLLIRWHIQIHGWNKVYFEGLNPHDSINKPK